MIYYPLSTLMLAGVRDILIISTPRDLPRFEELLGDGSQIGLSLRYTAQDKPRGLADAFLVGRGFIGGDDVCLVLGDNIFYGYGFSSRLQAIAAQVAGATIFGCHVSNPSDFGVVEYDANGSVISIEEKPKHPKSHYAVPGLYFYDNQVVEIAENLKPSARGELEITDVHSEYLRRGRLKVELLGRGMAWLDTGTHRSMLEAANFVEAVQTRQGLYIACLEEVAYTMGYINKDQLRAQGERLKASDYGRYILRCSEVER
jgi:glucose-1-phosphate thymidylyltransferase